MMMSFMFRSLVSNGARDNGGYVWRGAGSTPDRCQQRKLTADATGEVETEEGVLVIRRIDVRMRLVAPEEARPTVERTPGISSLEAARRIVGALQLWDTKS
jgi:hypothetical protein